MYLPTLRANDTYSDTNSIQYGHSHIDRYALSSVADVIVSLLRQPLKRRDTTRVEARSGKLRRQRLLDFTIVRLTRLCGVILHCLDLERNIQPTIRVLKVVHKLAVQQRFLDFFSVAERNSTFILFWKFFIKTSNLCK